MGTANPLAYGILGGIGGYADSQAQEANYAQRLREQAMMRSQQEDQRQQDRLELARERASLTASGKEHFDPAMAEQQYRFATGMTPEEEQAVRSGDAYVTQRVKQFNEDGSSSVVSESRVDGWEGLQKQKLAELSAIRKNVAFGKNAKVAADAESEYQDIGMTEGVRKKDGDYAGLLAKQGKGLYDNAGESGSFNVETGDSKLNDLGKAKAGKESAEGGWYGRRTSNDTSGAEERRDRKEQRMLLTTKIADLSNALKSGQSKDRKGDQETLVQLRQKLQKLDASGDDEPAATTPKRLKYNPTTGKFE